jgi:hypothetical protein
LLVIESLNTFVDAAKLPPTFATVYLRTSFEVTANAWAPMISDYAAIFVTIYSPAFTID